MLANTRGGRPHQKQGAGRTKLGSVWIREIEQLGKGTVMADFAAGRNEPKVWLAEALGAGKPQRWGGGGVRVSKPADAGLNR